MHVCDDPVFSSSDEQDNSMAMLIFCVGNGSRLRSVILLIQNRIEYDILIADSDLLSCCIEDHNDSFDVSFVVSEI